MVYGKIPPRKKPPGNVPCRKLPPGKLPPEKIPPKNSFTSLVVVDIILHLFIFKFSIVTSFRDVSGTPATSIMDPLCDIS